MPSGIRLDPVSAGGLSTCNNLWRGTLSLWAYENEDHVLVMVRVLQTQWYGQGIISGTFNGTLTINGESQNFTINTLPYQVADYRSVYETEYFPIYFDEDGIAEISVDVKVRGASGTMFSGYTLGGVLNHSYSNAAGPGSIEMSPSAQRMGDTAILAISKGTGAVTHKATYSFGSVTKVIANFVNREYQYEWTIPDLSSECSNAISGVLTITLDTYRFGTLVGSDSVSREILVPPASEIVLQDMDVGEVTPITIKRNSTNFTSTIRAFVLQQKVIVATDCAQDTFNWNIPTSVAKLMPNTTEETIYLYCDTYNGTALVGSTSAKATISVDPEDSRFKPVIDSVTVEGTIPDAADAFKKLILQNVSGVAVSVEAHSDVSTITGYEIAVFGDNFSGEDGKFDIVANSFAGVHTMTVRVTDARGSSAETTQDVTILPYIKPKVVPYSVGDVQYSAPICYRSDREGMASGNGTFMRILAGKMCTEILQDGVNINASKLEYRTRKSTEDWPEDYITLFPFQNDVNYVSEIIDDAYPDPKSSYQTEIRVTDLVGFSHSIFVKISSQKVSFSLLCAAAGAAFGKTAEFPDVVEIASDMTLWVRGKIEVDNAELVALQCNENESCWESGYAYGHHSVSGCYYGTEFGSKVNIVFNRAILWSGSKIYLNSEALPEEMRPAVPISKLCAADGGLVMATVGTDGFITIDFAWSPESKNEFHWIDGLVTYWKEDI